MLIAITDGNLKLLGMEVGFGFSGIFLKDLLKDPWTWIFKKKNFLNLPREFRPSKPDFAGTFLKLWGMEAGYRFSGIFSKDLLKDPQTWIFKIFYSFFTLLLLLFRGGSGL